METPLQVIVRRWRVFWLWHGGYDFWGRMGSRLASIGMGRYRHRHALSQLTPRGFIDPTAEVIDIELGLGSNVFIGERSILARWRGQGTIQLRDKVIIHRDCSLEITTGGAIEVGPGSSFERGCVLFSAVEPIKIGCRVEIAAYCAFYSYDHGVALGQDICTQPLSAKGPVVLGDDTWLGVGVTILSGVTIGNGAVIGAGSVVTRDIPPAAIAAGVPARVVKYRADAKKQSPPR